MSNKLKYSDKRYHDKRNIDENNILSVQYQFNEWSLKMDD